MGLTSVRAGAIVLAGLLLGACSATVDGQGSGGSSSAGASTSPDFPTASGSPAPSGPTSAAPSTPRPSPSYRVVTVDQASGVPIIARVYAEDKITDCAAHAYGARMISFLRAHACHSAKRVIATIVVGGRTVVLSSIATGFTGTAKDPYGVAAQFSRLERADGTGSINDLLREGHAIAGIASRIPEHEVFQVIGQDDGVTIFDAWYQSGGTEENDATLKKLEEALFLTSLTTG